MVNIEHKEAIIQGVPGGNVNILGGQKIMYVHVSYSERFPR
jgi:hypothetical protein